jgi:hypothetical protein
MTDRPLDCQAARDELPALLYDDLDETLRRRVEEHLDACDECRAELDGHRRTMRLLDAWSVDTAPPKDAGPPAQSHRWRVYGWLRPVLTGAAAAVVAFAVLGVLGADLQYEDSRLTVTIGARLSPAINDLQRTEAIAPVVRAVAGDELDARCEALLRILDAKLVEFGRREEQRRVLFANAVDLRRDEDLRQQEALLQTLAEHVGAEALRTRHALDDIRTWIAMGERAATPDDSLN